MKIKPLVFRNGELRSDASENYRAEHLSLSGFRGDNLSGAITTSRPQNALALTDTGPQFAAFTAGNILVYRVGDGSAALTNASTAVFIDEYTTAGVLVQTIALPTSTVGSQHALTAAGTSASEGLITLSADGHYLLLTGYDSVTGVASISGTASAAVNRVVGRISADGTVDTSTSLSDFSTASSPRGVASTNGTDIWVAGGAGGLRYTTFGSTTSTQISTSVTNLRSVEIFDGQLYVSSMSGAFRLASVGTGTPTTSGQVIANLPGMPTTSSTNSPYQYFFADLNAGVAGVDTVYVSDDATGLLKYSLVAGTWTLNGTIGVNADDYVGLTGVVSGGTVTLYATRLNGSAADQIVSLVDTGGYNAAYSSTTPTIVFTAANTNVGLRGIAFTPTSGPNPNGSLAIDDVSHVEGDTGTTTYTFTVTRSGGSTGAVSATWTLAAPGGAGNADSTDFAAGQLTTGTVSFADGETSKTITILVQGDNLVETNETFTVTLSAPTGGATISDAFGTGTITNDDFAGSVSISSAVSVPEGNAGTTNLVFTVTRSGGSDGAVSVDWTLNLPGGVGGADSTDLAAGQLTAGTVNFADGETVKTITIQVQGDTTFEPDETFTVTLGNPLGGLTIGSGTGTGTIQNDDPQPPAGTLSINDVSLAEGDSGVTNFTFTVTRAGGSSGAITADYTITAPGGAGNADSTDFAPGSVFSGQVSFADGETSKTITIGVQGDTNIETNETFTVTLSNPSGTATIGDGTGIGTIQNDDLPPPVASIGDATVVEGADGVSYMVFTVSLDHASASTVTVDYATANGTALAGSDYVARSGQVSFAPGELSHTVSIPIIGDTVAEADETFTVTLSSPTNATIGDGSGLGTITNDDGTPYYSLAGGSFTQNWSNTGLITTNDNWSGVPFIIGFRGDDLTTATGTDARTILSSSNVIDVNANQSNPNTNTSGGVTEFDGIANPVVALQGSGTADAPYLALYMDASGRSNIRVQANLRDIDGSTDDAAQQIAVQYRTSPNGPWVNAPGGYFADVTTGGSATQVTAVDITLPSDANGAATLEIRFLTTNAAGNDEWVGIDDIVVSSQQSAPILSIGNTAVFEGDAGTTPITFTVTRSGDSAGAVTADWTVNFPGGVNGATANDFAVGQLFNGQVAFADGQTSATITLNIAGDVNPELDDNFTVTLSNTVGGTIGDGVATGTIINDDGQPPLVTVNDVTVTEGDAGTSLMTFTITRTGGTGAFDVNYQTQDGTATAGSDYVSTSGILHFAAGQTTATVSVTINGDTNSEVSETLNLILSNPTNFALLADPVGVGTIAGDDPIYIHDIQGTAYFSPILAAEGIHSFNTASTGFVTVRAIVTAVDNAGSRQGFYITEEYSDWDGNSWTSEGIFVMTRNDAGVGNVVSGVSVGDLVQLSAQVMEYQSFNTMPRTVLVNPTGLSVISSGNALPTITLTNIPNAVLTAVTPDYLDAGGGPTFDAAHYALSYFESVEGMLVTVPNMVVADGFVSTSGGRPYFQAYSLDSANPSQINSRGGYTIAGDPPVGPPDTPGIGDDTNHGGRHLHDGDINPDTIEVDFSDFAMAPPTGLATGASMGDHLGNVTGIIDFDFTDRKLFVTSMEPGGFVDGNVTQETTLFGGDSRALTMAAFNVNNLDPSDGAARFTAIANAIAHNLNAPDIISIEEIQDNNGAVNDGTTDASTTWQMLVDALNLATGAHYQWVDQAPTNGAEGGEPGGNIRVGFLYNTDRVQLGDLAADATLAERRQFTDRIGDGVRDAGDRIAFDDSMIASEIASGDWSSTRRSLLGEFTFHGNTVYVTANHFTAKGGSGEFWQFDQDLESGDPINAGWSKRNEQAQDIYTMLNLIQQSNPNAGIISGGDYNDFYFYQPLTTLTGYTNADGTARVGGARFDNLTLTLPEAERYTYTFDGRSQAIDHIVVNDLLAAVATYDVVHLNTGFNPSNSLAISDHDPGISTFDFRNFNEVLAGTAAADSINGYGGNDVIFGGDGDDVLNGGTGIDQLAGGQGNDIYVVDNAADVVVEAAGQGYDVVYTTVDYTLAAGQAIEGLVALDFAGTAPLNLTGNEIANYLLGNAGANQLNGGAGADAMEGRGGNDIYVVDNAGDVVIEAAGQGYDVVYTSVNYTLGAGQEIEGLVALDASATTALNLTGNEFANYLLGNAGANQLNGGAGADILEGRGGNDIYVVDNAADVVIEAAAQGYDVVYSSVSYTLTAGQEIEGLVALDASATTSLTLTGNAFANYLLGNAGGNVLNGGAGADIMEGRGGHDIYIVDNAGDVVIEAAGNGFDTVYTSVSFTLTAGQEIEGLTTSDFNGTAAINLTGNEFGNYLIGNEGANVLNGGAGSDTLHGGGGADTFAFSSAIGGSNVDYIDDFVHGVDRIALDDAIFHGIGTPGSFNANSFVVGTQAGDADDRIIYNQATGQLFYDADGNGSGAAVLFATLNGAPTLTASDFQVI